MRRRWGVRIRDAVSAVLTFESFAELPSTRCADYERSADVLNLEILAPLGRST